MFYDELLFFLLFLYSFLSALISTYISNFALIEGLTCDTVRSPWLDVPSPCLTCRFWMSNCRRRGRCALDKCYAYSSGARRRESVTEQQATEQQASREAHLNTNGRKGNSSSVRSDTQGVAGKTAGSRTYAQNAADGYSRYDTSRLAHR